MAIQAQGAAHFHVVNSADGDGGGKIQGAEFSSKQREFNDFLYRQEQQQVSLRKQSMQETLQVHFPYPVSQVFFSYQHELDYHRRFQLILQLYEVAINNVTIVGISGYLSGREQDGAINALLRENFRRPSLGDRRRRRGAAEELSGLCQAAATGLGAGCAPQSPQLFE